MTEKATKFISEEIEMLETSEVGEPVRFIYRNEAHVVTDIIKDWQDWGHAAGTFKKSWKNRRHRNYFEIRTDCGLHLLVYFDRGVKPSSPRKWVVLEQYDS